MRWLIRGFFKTIRMIMGPFMLLWEWLATPKAPQRTQEDQAALDAMTSNMTLFQFKTCPFCIKTRIAMAKCGLNIRKQDAQFDNSARNQLLQATGKVQVPCLKIGEGSDAKWLLESDEIIAYFEQLVVEADVTQEA
ncbi:MAG: glutaredoxin family protein [bacterium]